MVGLGFIKAVSSIIVTVGVGNIVSNAIKVVTPATTGKIAKFCMGIGGLALGGFFCEVAVKEADHMIDLAAEMIDGKSEDDEKIENEEEEA